ncbi:GATA transcription factor 9-like isoform X2 [Lotus japonicus]|uniref:GATA transcription factor 9-like isoform X2 n=1 Tax=Lotus japonicus TaxID=34305 RepID=UPI00259054C0|nr:GATA transcription factor 9-like isoform X2 [Lotus japonicus]
MEAPEYFVGGYYGAGGQDQFSPAEKRHTDQKPGEPFAIDDLFDFSNADAIMSDGFFDNVAGNSTDSSTVTAVDSCNSSISGGDNNRFAAAIVPRGFASDLHLSGELCVPYDEMAELEWLSNFVEDSFSAEEELRTLKLLSGAAATTTVGTKPQTPESSSSTDTLPPFAADDSTRNAPFLISETPLPGKARSKRSRPAPGDWSTRLLHLVSPSDAPSQQQKVAPVKKREGLNTECTGRKCLHCGAEKTPQWRTGPMGPKTLCNACGVRFKSGRLVAEYRPAASPTFVSARHSNSHRKVLELRRQKDMQRQQQQQLMSQSSIFGGSNGGDEFMIRHHHQHHHHQQQQQQQQQQHCGPEFRHVI